MKRVNNLFEKIASFENLHKAFLKAKKGTKNYQSYKFSYNIGNELVYLRNNLLNQTYFPEKYRYFLIKEPKEREISVASFRDRVVHHAIVNVLEPIYEKVFIYDSYATRKNKGTHKAIRRAQSFMKQSSWFLKSDISKYFENIEHNTLIKIIEKKIKDKKTVLLIEKIIKNHDKADKGIPIGNLTSQFFANVYLDQFDHFVKDQCGIKYYIRYMDDFVIFSEDKNFLKKFKNTMELYLFENLKLKLKEKATFINSRKNGLSFLGSRVFSNTLKINPENLKRSLKKINMRKKQLEKNEISEKKFLTSMTSIIEGNMSYFDTFNLRYDIFNKGILS